MGSSFTRSTRPPNRIVLYFSFFLFFPISSVMFGYRFTRSSNFPNDQFFFETKIFGVKNLFCFSYFVAVCLRGLFIFLFFIFLSIHPPGGSLAMAIQRVTHSSPYQQR